MKLMAFYGVYIPPSNHHKTYLILPNLKPSLLLPPKPRKLIPNPPLISSNFGRRTVIHLSFLGFLLSFTDQPLFSKNALASELLELDRYNDSIQGFTLLVPSSWIKVDKAGATVLFEDVNKKANNVGVVVNPTRISTLGEFGTPQFVVDKLIQAERRKESTKEVELISFSERSNPGGPQVYEFEYKVDSTRGGLKRFFSAAFVSSKKLYLLNITHSDGLDNPLESERRMVLEQVLHSFDAIPST